MQAIRPKPSVAAVALVAALLGSASTAAIAATTAPAPAPDQTASQMDAVSIAAQAAPSLVSVEAVRADDGLPFAMFEQRDLFEEFAQRFGMRFPEPMFDMPLMPGRHRTTGLIVSEDGRIVTSASALEGASAVRVTLADGRRFDATVVGTDELTDIALLKIDATGLPTLPFASADAVKLGEPVVVLGAGRMPGSALSTGVVSALDGQDQAGPLYDFIQTDATIGMGNEGGVILNKAGEVLAINAHRLSPGRGFAATNVALPASVAADVIADLSDDGQIDRGFLGVQIAPVSEDVAAALGLESRLGAFVTGVAPGTPAEQAGLRRGDVILSVQGAEIKTPRDLTRVIASQRPGTEVTMQLLRAGQPQSLTVTLGNRAEQKV